MKYFLLIAAMLASLFAADFSQMSTEEMMKMRGNVPVEQREDFRKEMQKRMQAMTPQERQMYGMQGKGMNQGQGMMPNKKGANCPQQKISNDQANYSGQKMMNKRGMYCGPEVVHHPCMHCCCCCCGTMMYDQSRACGSKKMNCQGNQNRQGMKQGQGMMNNQ